MRDLRAYFIGGLMAATVVTAAACSNDLVAPSQSGTGRVIAPSQMPFFASHDVGSSSSATPTATVTFTIRPHDDNNIPIGQHLLVIPANEVCDPATSGYGVGTWDLPCATITRPLTVTAHAAIGADGHPFVTFDTHLRFKPVKADKDAVFLYLRDPNADPKSKIIWCPDDKTSFCVDETALAPQMQTHWDRGVTTVYRKILHFSGYNVTGGSDGSDGGF